MKAKVYSYTKYDIATGSVVVALRKGTREAIQSIDDAMIIESTNEEIDTSLLDKNGMVR